MSCQIFDYFTQSNEGQFFRVVLFSFLDPSPLKKASLLHVYYMAYIEKVFRFSFFFNIYAFSSFSIPFSFYSFFFLSIQKDKGKRTQLNREEKSVEISLGYRVSHSKPSKVILLWWRYRLWFLLIFWILRVHEKGTFMPNSSVFIFLMLCALYGSIRENLLFLNEFWVFLSFSSLFRVIESNN